MRVQRVRYLAAVWVLLTLIVFGSSTGMAGLTTLAILVLGLQVGVTIPGEGATLATVLSLSLIHI